MTPQGYLLSFTRILNAHARYGDTKGFYAYVCSDAFRVAFNGLDPVRRHTAMLSYAKAQSLCEAKARMPLTKPKTLAEGARIEHANWRDPAMLEKLRRAKTPELGARLCGVSIKAAKIAYKRYVGDPTTWGRAEAA